MSLRLLLYDRTCTGPLWRPGLSHIWQAGSWLYRGLARFDGVRGIASWAEGLRWLSEVHPGQSIAEVQYWGHGKWGNIRVGQQSLDRSALAPGHPLGGQLRALRQRIGGDSLWWFRTCETFGANAGQDFARAWTDFFGCPAAGHTYIIAFWQSGLHLLKPGAAPNWAADEGLSEGSADAPEQALWSSRSAPNTISCLSSAIPDRCR